MDLAINGYKNHRSRGPDRITANLAKFLDGAMGEIHECCNPGLSLMFAFDFVLYDIRSVRQ